MGELWRIDAAGGGCGECVDGGAGGVVGCFVEVGVEGVSSMSYSFYFASLISSCGNHAKSSWLGVRKLMVCAVIENGSRNSRSNRSVQDQGISE